VRLLLPAMRENNLNGGRVGDPFNGCTNGGGHKSPSLRSEDSCQIPGATICPMNTLDFVMPGGGISFLCGYEKAGWDSDV
jgi:hypothetical protein